MKGPLTVTSVTLLLSTMIIKNSEDKNKQNTKKMNGNILAEKKKLRW